MAPSRVEDSGRIARVVVLLRLHHLGDRQFDYVIPEHLADALSVGSVVTVPFGKRTARAVVIAVAARAEVPEAGLRAIEAVGSDRIPEELLDLAQALAKRYLCSLESCLRLVAPVGSASGRGAKASTRRDLVARLPDPDQAVVAKLTAKQEKVLEAIPAEGVSKKMLCDLADVGRGVLDTLEKRGLVEFREMGAEGEDTEATQAIAATLAPDAPGDGGVAGSPHTLWPDQEQAVDDLIAALDEPGFSLRLLWGVTGSGKTEVYLRLIEHALKTGRGAILLVPEIALTPQTIRRVKTRFGSRVGVFHSGLPLGERVREYRRVASGEAPIVVGARSAVFAPVNDLGLIIIDEAHDNSYKQEEEPRYRVKTVAELRLAERGGLLLEGSATPAVESMVSAEDRVRLTRRAAGTQPDIEVVDMRRQGARSPARPSFA